MPTDQIDDLIAASTGLQELVRALTSPATPSELAGEQAALLMFRRVMKAPARHRRIRQRPWRHPARIGAAGLLAACASFAAAGYAAALPVPVQHVAHDLLGFAGVPEPGARDRTPPVTSPPAGSSTGPGSPAPRSSQPSPSAPPDTAFRLVARLARTQIAAGTAAVVTAGLTGHDRAVRGATLTLQEMTAGTHRWQSVARAATSKTGQATLTAPSLTTNAAFRVTGPNRTATTTMHVIVIPAVTVSVRNAGRSGARTVAVACRLARPGDVVVLQVRSSGLWHDLHSRKLSQAGQATFGLKASKTGASYRIVLLATADHGSSASRVIVVPPHSGNSGRGRHSPLPGQHSSPPA